MKQKAILTPVNIGGVRLRNRIAMPPMSTRLSNADGSVTQRLIDYYEERAIGGVGLIIVEYSYIDEERSKAAVCQLGAYSDNLLPGLSELSEAIQRRGAKTFLQICHGGGQSPADLISGAPGAPSAILVKKGGHLPTELSIDEIKEIIHSFAEAALRAKKAGFDGVEIHGAHGYLLNQFLSPRCNKRSDLYGADLAGRTQMALEVVDAIRAKVGSRFVVGFRLNVEDYTPSGITVDETRIFVRMLEEHGISYIHASAGTYESHQYMISPTYLDRGHLSGLAKAVKDVVSVPVIAVGGLNDEVGSKLIDEGLADIAAMGRALIADPSLPNKMARGLDKEIRPCIRCNDGCIGRFFAGKTMRCATNPAAGREADFRTASVRSSVPKKIAIVGGGVAGMECARIAAGRGHDVQLFEKSGELGGNARVASVPSFKGDIRQLLKWYEYQMAAPGITVHLGGEASLREMEALNPDAVVMALGAEHYGGPVGWGAEENVMTASEVLLGTRLPKGNVVVIGGGLVGVETALYMAGAGNEQRVGKKSIRQITIIEVLEEILVDAVRVNKLELAELIEKHGIKCLTASKVCKISQDCLEFVDEEQNIVRMEADCVVLAVGFRSRECDWEPWANRSYEVHTIGDGHKPGKIIDAIREAALVGMEI
ncbi:MAG: oxidoreductase [Thermoleophilia bacterium]